MTCTTNLTWLAFARLLAQICFPRRLQVAMLTFNIDHLMPNARSSADINSHVLAHERELHNFLIPCNESVVTLTPTPCVRARFSHPFGASHLPSIHPQSTVRSFGYHALEKGLAPAITRSQKSCENRRPVPSETHSPCMTKAVQKPTRHSGHRGKRTPH